LVFATILSKPDLHDAATIICIERGNTPNYDEDVVLEPAFEGETPLQKFERLLNMGDEFKDMVMKKRFGLTVKEVKNEIGKKKYVDIILSPKPTISPS
jgi:hypothetical protein